MNADEIFINLLFVFLGIITLTIIYLRVTGF